MTRMVGRLSPWPLRWPSPAKLCDYCGRVIPAAALSVLVDPHVPFGEIVARICPLCRALGRQVRPPPVGHPFRLRGRGRH